VVRDQIIKGVNVLPLLMLQNTKQIMKKKAEHKMMDKDQMMNMDHKAATAAPNTTAPQATMHESMHENTTPEKQAPKS